MDNSTNLDFSYEHYQKIQLSALAIERIKESAFASKKANFFDREINNWQARPYEGYGMITMLTDTELNQNLCSTLINFQKELQSKLGADDILYHLPPQSFHQTIANTLSNERYRQQLLEKSLLKKFPGIINTACENLSQIKAAPIMMRLQGMTVFSNAIGILGIFDTISDYKRITDFRASFYGNKVLEQVDIKMTRPFIGHITLAYIESDMSVREKIALAESIIELNKKIEKAHLLFAITGTCLTYFMHLNHFSKEAKFAHINL